ncbi:MAG: immunoglobulin domain-containing protein [Verrucomicrobia bacterium]|nr:immunoglobulin domain-containing protein [Verrucomicrobiota bacterium]
MNNLSANPLPGDISYVSIISTGLKLLLLPDQIGDGIVSTASQNLGNVAGANLLNHTARELFVLPRAGCDPLKKADPVNGDYLSHTCATGDGGVHAELIRQLRPLSSPAETADGPVPYRFTTLAGLAASSGSADGTGTSVRFNSPTGVAVDRVGNIYVADYGNHTIRKITADARVSTVAGLVGSPGNANGSGSVAQFNNPIGVTVDLIGNIYVADSGNNRIREIFPSGEVITLFSGKGVSVDIGLRTFYVLSGHSVHSSSYVCCPRYGGTYAGSVSTPGSRDGQGSNARFNSPEGVAVDSAGNVYVADTGNNTIRKITPERAVSTLAGLAGFTGSRDGTGSSALFNSPKGVAGDSAGNVYVADTLNHTIRKISASGVVTTLAGLAGVSGSTDGTWTAARFHFPIGIAIDNAGIIYVADSANHTIRKGVPLIAPTIIKQPQNQVVRIGASLTFSVSAAGTVPFIYQWYFDGKAIPGATAATFTITNMQQEKQGTYSVLISNGVGSIQSQGASLNVMNTAPILAQALDRITAEGEEGKEISLLIQATDSESPPQMLTFSLEGPAPVGASIDPVRGTFTWTPTESQGPSTNRITVRVTDNGNPPLSDTKTFPVIVSEVNSPPAISAISDKFLEENSKLEFLVEALDPDIPSNALTYALGTGAPAGASVNPRTGVFSWAIGEVAAPETNRVSVVVTDDGAPPRAATNVFQVVVTPGKLRLAPIPDRSEDEGTVIAFAVAAIENPLVRPPLTYGLEPGAPEGALMAPATGAFLWQPTEAQGPSTNTITVRVTDSSSRPLTATRSFTVIVREVNRPPVLDAIPPQRVMAGQLLKLTAKAQDPDLPANELAYSLEPGAPLGASIDAKTGLFSWTPGSAGTNTLTIKVTDGGSPPLSHTTTVTVVATAPEGPKLLGSFLPNGQFQVTLTGEIGRIYLIQASTDLVVWEPVTNILSTAATILITDPAATSLRQRFYRALSP